MGWVVGQLFCRSAYYDFDGLVGHGIAPGQGLARVEVRDPRQSKPSHFHHPPEGLPFWDPGRTILANVSLLFETAPTTIQTNTPVFNPLRDLIISLRFPVQPS